MSATGRWSGNAHVSRRTLSGLPVEAALVASGKQLPADATVAEARALLLPEPVQLVPLVDAGGRYAGALGRADVPASAAAAEPVAPYASFDAPTAPAGMPLDEALERLDRHGGRRLVVLGGDGATFVGVVCLRRDRDRLCIDADLLGRAQRSATLRSAPE